MFQKLRAFLLIGALVAGSDAAAATIEPMGRDSSALAAAIAQAQPQDTVRLAQGTFELTDPVRPKSGIKLIGAGQGKTVIVYAGAKPSSLVSLADCEDVEIAHLTLDGRSIPLVQQGILAKSSRRLWLHHLTICNLKADTGSQHAILFSGHNPTMEGGVTDSRVSDCRIENVGREAKFGGGIRMAWGSARNQVFNNTIHNTGRGGIFGDHSAELAIHNNRVSGSGGAGLGIEIWGGCPRSLIEDNCIDHWLSVDRGDRSAVRRNVIGADDGTLKPIGIEIIARDVVVTDNTVNRGARTGLSVSNTLVKNNVFWGYNTVRDCIQWGAQLQGESGGIAHHYFYHCRFESTVRGDPRARYQDSGHGLRINGACRSTVFEECGFSRNGGYGVQFLGGPSVGEIAFSRCLIRSNALAAIRGTLQPGAIGFSGCTIEGNQSNQIPEAKPFPGVPPVADFRLPEVIHAGETVPFQCLSKAAAGSIVERLWDFGHGIPEVTAGPTHRYDVPGTYRVTLIVWDKAGRGGRMEKMVRVLPSK